MENIIKVGSDFSGVGAFDYAINRVAEKTGFEIENVFACDMDKYARISYLANHKEPGYYPENVYERKIPKESLDIYMTSPPCFVGETLVNTMEGFKKIKDLKIGELVLTHKNRYKKIVDFGFKKTETYILKAQGIIDTRTTSNHRYYVREKYRVWDKEKRKGVRVFSEPKWVEVKDLTKNHFLGINIPNINENPHNIDNDLAYVLGRYVADGWLRIRDNGKGNSIVIAIGKDKIDSISEKIKLKHSLSKEINGCSKLFIYSNKIVSLILDLGLGLGAINKRIPQSIINLPIEILKCFLQGYMDGDGYKSRFGFKATSISKELLMGIQLCVAKIYKTNSNICFVKKSKTTVIQGRTVNQRDYYMLEFRTEMKKQSNAVIIDDIVWYPIRSVNKSNETETVYDITVDEDHSFTANNAIVHNCQAFSLAGKRQGKNDKRGILFFNSHEFIKENKPRFFIFENVKGLLSADGGKTFQEWINMLGGKSVNGLPILFPYEDSVPYHLYWQVLNTKKHGIPQNRERVFIVGIRDDEDNDFQFPKEEHLKLRLKNLLEENVNEKYFLSDKIQNQLVLNNSKGSVIGTTKPEFRTIGERDNVHNIESYMSCLTATDYKQPKQILITSNTKKGYDIATENDSINFSVPTSETRRGRVGVGVAQTLDTQCNQGVWVGDYRKDEGLLIREDGNSPAIMAMMRDTWKDNFTGQNPPIKNGLNNYKIRRLTPLECFRLQDFPDSHVENSKKAGISDSQLYKQAGNSITVRVLEKIIDKLLIIRNKLE